MNSQQLHICFISQEYPPETGWGGIGSYTYEMAHGLALAGHRVTVISRAIEHERVYQENNIEIHRILPTPNWNQWPGLWRLNGYWPGFAWAAGQRISVINRTQPIDVIEAGEGRADSFFIQWIKPRPKVLVRLHTAWIFVDKFNHTSPTFKKRLIYWLEKQAILKADAVTAPSHAVVGLTGSWIPLNGQAVQVIPNPVNTSIFSVTGQPRRNRILFVGRLERRKGIADLVEAIPLILGRCPQTTLRFLGKDSVDETGCSWREKILARVSAKQHQQIEFGHVSRSELPDAYRQAALCVFPSIWENFPYVVLEAMACGTPVVVTNTGGMPEIVQDQVNGLLVPSETPTELVQAVCTLLENPAKRERMGYEARRRIETQFDTCRVVPAMLDVYNNVLHHNGHR
jgi:glycosyltransferase involved in cell wall biosynthesis